MSHMSTVTTVTWGIFFSILLINAGLFLKIDDIGPRWMWAVSAVIVLDCLLILIYQREHWSRKTNNLRLKKVRNAFQEKSGGRINLFVKDPAERYGYRLYTALHWFLLMTPLYLALECSNYTFIRLFQHVPGQIVCLNPFFGIAISSVIIFAAICIFWEIKNHEKLENQA